MLKCNSRNLNATAVKERQFPLVGKKEKKHELVLSSQAVTFKKHYKIGKYWRRICPTYTDVELIHHCYLRPVEDLQEFFPPYCLDFIVLLSKNVFVRNLYLPISWGG